MKKLKRIVKKAGQDIERTLERVGTHPEREASRNILNTINTDFNDINTTEKMTEITTKIADLRTQLTQLDYNAINLPQYSIINDCWTIIDQFIISMTQAHESIATARSLMYKLQGDISARPNNRHLDSDVKTDCADTLKEMQTTQTTFNTTYIEFISYYHAIKSQITSIEVLMERLTTPAAPTPIVTAFRQQQEHTEEALLATPESGLHLALRMS
ncbi:MAG: hypothetical protein ABSA84_00050 [Gammaproteobacteria bacterium]|jgi:hypothetical protein